MEIIMNDLLGSLGLDKVESDPNNIPDGKYVGEVMKSEVVYVKSNDTVSHVITYKVTDGTYTGAQRAEWFRLGTSPTFGDDGNINGYTPTMSDQQKQWYKKRFVDLGVAEADIPTLDITSLVGTPVTFGVKRRDGYVNVNFAEKRDGAAASPQSTTPAGPGGMQGLL